MSGYDRAGKTPQPRRANGLLAPNPLQDRVVSSTRDKCQKSTTLAHPHLAQVEHLG